MANSHQPSPGRNVAARAAQGRRERAPGRARRNGRAVDPRRPGTGSGRSEEGWTSGAGTSRSSSGRCKEGSEAAYAVLVRLHRPRLYKLAYRLLLDRESAEDVVQETFIAAFRQMERFEPRPSLSAWLNTIVLRTAGRAAAHRRARPRYVDRHIGLPGRRARCDRRQRMARRRPGARGRRPHRRPPGRGGGCRSARGDRRRHRGAALQVPRRRRGPPRDGPRLRGGRPDAGRAAQHVQEQPAAGHEDAPRIPCGPSSTGQPRPLAPLAPLLRRAAGPSAKPSGARPMDLRASDGRTPGTRATGG